MTSPPELQKYLALLRGINVGGHHKVPMADLKEDFIAMGFREVKTLLNSGNVVFEGKAEQEPILEKKISQYLNDSFGFNIPILVRKIEDIHNLVDRNPFNGIEMHKDLRLYVTFLKVLPREEFPLPWKSQDGSFQIFEIKDRMVFSVLDVSVSKTTDAMSMLEKSFGKDITTRNWNTLLKLVAL
jgi:uncharacterized protein (DUF1697 family)